MEAIHQRVKYCTFTHFAVGKSTIKICYFKINECSLITQTTDIYKSYRLVSVCFLFLFFAKCQIYSVANKVQMQAKRCSPIDLIG